MLYAHAMTERDDNRQADPESIQPTREELDQWKDLTAELPWRLTLGQFLKRVISEYGYELCDREVRDPSGNRVRLFYLKSPDGKRVVHLPGNLREEDQLDEIVTASLCRRIRIPPEDFGLLPEEDDY